MSEGDRLIGYGTHDDEFGVALFDPKCVKCGRYVEPHDDVTIDGEGRLSKQPNATCKRCGPTQMLFMGYD